MVKYSGTRIACYLGYIVQAIEVNFISLLILQFYREFDISIRLITLLITINFLVQTAIDIAAIFFVDRIGYKITSVSALVLVGVGMTCYWILPGNIMNPFAGLVVANVFCALGGGLLEVIISPIINYCPSKNKAAQMNLLHSFYCWGYVLFVVISLLYYRLAGIENWRYLLVAWIVMALICAVMFLFSPIPDIPMEYTREDGADGAKKNVMGMLLKILLPFMLIMVCSGAAEHGLCQWASALTEKELMLDKTFADLTGPLLFSALMGIGRLLYSIVGRRWNARRSLTIGFVGALISCLMVALGPSYLVVAGFAIGGIFISIMWPCSLAVASERYPNGGTKMFAILAICGDIGCIVGPTLVGMISSGFSDNIRMGILGVCIIPVIGVLTLVFLRERVIKEREN